ncbi:protein phosphatase 2C domain-containing protein [Streptosporangium sp. NPDC048047]|uniref:protein phosphatase 2C domain-containing protein n=1 Tax=Streptosporangium sp. NPDC048047 TaxID=3155748 RepID=UPI003421728B
MRITHETAAAPGRPRNEDFVVTGPDWAAVLDGATAPAGVVSGCVHDVPWLVARLGGALAHRLATGSRESLPDLVAAVIRDTMTAHGDACDLTGPDSPSSTMTVLRRRGGTLDYLVLCDSPIVLRHTGGAVTVLDDDRLDHLPGGRPYGLELVRGLRNRPGGFWVASVVPEAAYEARAGSVPLADVSGALLATDGVTRLVEAYGWTWERLVAVADADGPGRLIAEVRAAELEHGAPHPTAKPHDDATAIWMTW